MLTASSCYLGHLRHDACGIRFRRFHVNSLAPGLFRQRKIGKGKAKFSKFKDSFVFNFQVDLLQMTK